MYVVRYSRDTYLVEDEEIPNQCLIATDSSRYSAVVSILLIEMYVSVTSQHVAQ